MRRIAPLAILPVLLLAACAGQGAPTAGEGPAEVYRPDEVVLRSESVGGFVPVDYTFTRLPDITVYGDGRVITQGAMPAIYPPYALPAIAQSRLSADAVDHLVRLAIEAGIGDDDDYGMPPVADVPDTHFIVVSDHGVRESTVYALGFDGPDLSPAQQAARGKLKAFAEMLADLAKTVGADKVADEGLYQPTSMALIVRSWSGDDDPNLPQPPRDWPGPALPGEELRQGLGVSCLTVTGAELTAVTEAAASANTLTPWVWEGSSYLVAFRPLLPDESSCADLG